MLHKRLRPSPRDHLRRLPNRKTSSALGCAIQPSAPLARVNFRAAWYRPEITPPEDSTPPGPELPAKAWSPNHSPKARCQSIDTERDCEPENPAARRSAETSVCPVLEAPRKPDDTTPANRRADRPVADTTVPSADPR